MTTFVALLRGIHVSGQKSIRMAELRKSCEALGLKDVRTYLQSGNVVFRAAASRKLADSLKARIAKDFGHDVEVLVLPRRTNSNESPLPIRCCDRAARKICFIALFFSSRSRRSVFANSNFPRSRENAPYCSAYKPCCFTARTAMEERS